MDAIRKKMKSLKDETDQLYSIINKFDEATKESNRVKFMIEICIFCADKFSGIYTFSIVVRNVDQSALLYCDSYL